MKQSLNLSFLLVLALITNFELIVTLENSVSQKGWGLLANLKPLPTIKLHSFS